MSLLQSLCHSLLVGVWLLLFASLLLCLGAWLGSSPGLRRLFARLERQFRALPAGGKLLAVVFLATFIVKGSTKTNNASSSAPPAGGLALEGGAPMSLDGGGEPLPRLSTNQYLAGFALVGVATNAASWPPAPSNAVPHTPWTRYGVAEDTFWLPATNWSFTLGTNAVEGLHVSSSGTLSFHHPKGSPRARAMPDGSDLDFLAPLQTSLGIVPPQGRFWHAPTPSNSLLLTWQDVYLARDTNAPVCVQSELFANGDFTFRYDLSALNPQAPTLPTTNFVIGAQHNRGGETYALADTNRLVNGLELRWRAFGLLDPGLEDHDDDALSTYAEVMLHGTDPRQPDSDLDGLTDGEEVAAGSDPLLRDTDLDGLIDGSDPDPLNATSPADADGDGIADAYELWRFGTTNAVNSLTADLATNGFLLATELAAGLDPRTAAAQATSPTNHLAALRLCGPFAATFAGATNLVYERTLRIDRAGGWQQYFLSAASNAPSGWALEGMILEWQDSGGASGSAAASPGDSLWLPLSTNGPATLTLRLRSTDATTRCAQPLHLLAWAPGVSLSGGTRGLTNGVTCTVLDLTKSDTLSVAFDRANRPCLAPPSAGELAATANPFAGPDAGLDFTPAFGEDGAATGGALSVGTPGCRDLPQLLPASAFAGGTDGGALPDKLLAIWPVLHWGDGLHSWSECGELISYNPFTGRYAESFRYPLDSGCLWRHWWRDSDGGFECTCEPRVSFGDSELDDWFQTVFDYPAVNRAEATATLGGTFIWSGEARHRTDTGGGCYERGVELLSSDECEDCSGCENGNCDGFEGPSTGSLAFRIPLGAPRRNQLSGFLWFRTDAPVLVTPGLFNLSARSDAQIQVESNNVGQAISRIRCDDERGRDLRISPMAGGVRIAVSNAPCTLLEHTWEITNVGGSPAAIRLRKISRINNTMSDHTYTCDGGVWTCSDNIAQVSETVTKTDNLNDPELETLLEERVLRDAGDVVLSHTLLESRRFGRGETAVLRETARFEMARGEDNWKSAHAAYWTDADNPRRNGRPKLVWGDDRAWRYQAWDEHGRETLRLDQWDGSAFPGGTLLGDTPLAVTNLPAGIVCTATEMDYTPHAGDPDHPDDSASPRTVAVHLVRGGAATLISRTWHIYTCGFFGDLATVTRRTIRAHSATAAIGDPRNAVSTETLFHSDAPRVPLLLRGRPLSSTGEDGVTTAYEYDLGTFDDATRAFTVSSAGPHLRTVSMQTTAAAPAGIAGKSVKHLTIQDATHGTTLHSATLAILPDGTQSEAFDWQTHTYDDKNRLRSTLHSDGSSTTNAWSCCRLLWWTRRDGARILRSAATGTDHLYYAMEEVSLAELPHDELYVPYDNWQTSDFDAFRVTQHYFDALGRETNTVVRPAKVEGAAIDPNFAYGKGWRISETTVFPDGTSDYSVRTDMRGVRTVSRSSAYEDRAEHQTQVFHPTNLVTPVSTELSIAYRNGATISQREWDDQWSRDTRWTEYDASGCRIDLHVTESSDHPAVTNSVTHCDFLGRAVATATPLGVTSNTYDGASMRVLATTRTGQPATAYLYDALGDRVGTVAAGITNRTGVSYEAVSNVLWRVTESCAGEARSVTRERLTGLSHTLRRHTLATGADNVTTEVTAAWNTTARTLTETVVSSVRATPAVRVTKYGRPISESSADGQRYWFFDPYGRAFYTERELPGTTARLSETWLGFNDCGDVAEHDTFIASGSTYAITSYAFDAFGRETSRTDALGHAVSNVYDALGRRVASSGATYPVTQGYDTAGRMTSLSTTRDGDALDTTLWLHDPATGVVTNKRYADDSVVAYSHDAASRPRRTTWARGAWRENAYDADGLLVATAYSDATPTVSRTYDTFQRLAAASNAVAAYAYANSDLGVATNETAVIGMNTYEIVREHDEFHRLSASSLSINGANKGGIHYRYDAESRLAELALTNAQGRGSQVAYSNYAGYSYGYRIATPSESIFTRSIQRDTYRRNLITQCGQSFEDMALNGYAYTYDLLNRVTGRNTDAFGYNTRSEVTSTVIQTNNASHYEYDGIGNALWTSFNAVTNTYAANALNQYTAINNDLLSYDVDGNLLTNGVWSYTWNAENRLVTVTSNGVLLVTNTYDHQHRRVRKVTSSATFDYIYDGWNLIHETISATNGAVTKIQYFWGTDLSGTLQGAGGVGGLLAVSLNGQFYFPCYDNNGNISAYVDESGAVVAEYVYDAFSRTLTATGPMADAFRHCFSTKYHDSETGLYYYGYRFYSPELGRWLNRDPIEENGGWNSYAFVENGPLNWCDCLGREKGGNSRKPPESLYSPPYARFVKWSYVVLYVNNRGTREKDWHYTQLPGKVAGKRAVGKTCWTVKKIRVESPNPTMPSVRREDGVLLFRPLVAFNEDANWKSPWENDYWGGGSSGGQGTMLMYVESNYGYAKPGATLIIRRKISADRIDGYDDETLPDIKVKFTVD